MAQHRLMIGLERLQRDYPSLEVHLAKAAASGESAKPKWSKPDSPSRWAKQFGISPKTFKKRVEEGKIRAKVLSDRSYQIAVSDLPVDAQT